MKALALLMALLALAPVAAYGGDLPMSDSQCTNAANVENYAGATVYCRQAAEDILDSISSDDLTGDSKALMLTIAAMDMAMLSVCERRDGLDEDAAQAPNDMAEAHDLIHQALQNAKSQHTIQRVEHVKAEIEGLP